jgi:hypothetical protein
MFLMMMVGVPGSSALALPRGPAIDVFNFGGGHCRSTDSTPRGPAIDAFFISAGGCCQTSASNPQGASHRCLGQLGTCY